MATAAPAPAAAPVAQPAAAEAAGSAPAAPGTQAGESTPVVQAAKSSRPRLPGVMEDGPETGDKTEATRREAAARDANGRFLKKAGGEPSAEERAGEPTPEPPPEPKQVFRFADQDFADQRAAEAAFKSERGKLVPVQRKLAETEGHLTKAAESARGWHSEAQRLAARVAELEAGGGQQPSSPDTQSQPAEAGSIDWGLYAEIVKAANEVGEPWKAQQWLVEQIDAQRARDIAAIRKEAIEDPRQAAAQEAELAQTADTIVDSMVAHKNPDGSPAFPEFADGQTAHEVGALWRSMGLPPELALTAGGAVAAVSLYRLARSMNAAPATPPPPAPDHAGAAAAALEGGRPMLPAAGTRSEMDPSVARLVSGLKNHAMIRPGLGFEA